SDREVHPWRGARGHARITAPRINRRRTKESRRCPRLCGLIRVLSPELWVLRRWRRSSQGSELRTQGKSLHRQGVFRPMTLPTFWFILIAVLWIGYLFLEGFDLGVGMHMRILARNEQERRLLLNTIGPVWDGNEVWLITAGGATFSAFPLWYAALFSALYIPLLLVLVGLIFRAIAIEY